MKLTVDVDGRPHFPQTKVDKDLVCACGYLVRYCPTLNRAFPTTVSWRLLTGRVED